MRTTTIINQEFKQAFELVDALLLKNPDNEDLRAAKQIAEEMSRLEEQYQAVVASGGTPSVIKLDDISKAAKLLENKFVEIAGKEQAAVMMLASKKRSSLLPGIKIHTADFLGELRKNNPFDLARLAHSVMSQHPDLLAKDTEKDLIKFVEKAIYPKGMPRKDRAIIAKAQQLIADVNKPGRSLKVNGLSPSEVKTLEKASLVMSGLVSAMHNKVVVISGKKMVPDVDVAKNNLSELSAMLNAKKKPPKELEGNTNAQLVALENEILAEDSARNLKDMATRLILQCAHAVGVLAREANKQQKSVDSDIDVTNASDIQGEKTVTEPDPELESDPQKKIAGEMASGTDTASSLTDDEGVENESDDLNQEEEQKVSSTKPKTREQLQAMLYDINPELRPAVKSPEPAPVAKAPQAPQAPPTLVTPETASKPISVKSVQLPSSAPKAQTTLEQTSEGLRKNFAGFLEQVKNSFSRYDGATHQNEQKKIMYKLSNLVDNLSANPNIDILKAKQLLIEDMQTQLNDINKNKRWFQREGDYSKLLKAQILKVGNYVPMYISAANPGTTKQILQQMNVDPVTARSASVKANADASEAAAPLIAPPSLVTPDVKPGQSEPNLPKPPRLK